MLRFAFLVLALLVVLTAATLFRNRVPLLDPPGPMERLRIYLTRHVAETADGHRFPELRTPVFELPADTLYRRVRANGLKLGWSLQEESPPERRLHFVVRTRWLGFRDDVRVRVVPLAADRSALHMRSASRIGRGDFGQNSAHLRRMLAQLGGRAEGAGIGQAPRLTSQK